MNKILLCINNYNYISNISCILIFSFLYFITKKAEQIDIKHGNLLQFFHWYCKTADFVIKYLKITFYTKLLLLECFFTSKGYQKKLKRRY